MTPSLSIEALRERVRYNPVSGKFTAIGSGGGRLLGTVNSSGYLRVVINGRSFYLHRLAWFYMTGDWPPVGFDVDHINEVKTDNRWSNLRLATRAQNVANIRGAHRDSLCGCRGVSASRSGRYVARIMVHGHLVHLGTFETVGEAARAYERARYDRFPEHASAPEPLSVAGAGSTAARPRGQATVARKGKAP